MRHYPRYDIYMVAGAEEPPRRRKRRDGVDVIMEEDEDMEDFDENMANPTPTPVMPTTMIPPPAVTTGAQMSMTTLTTPTITTTTMTGTQRRLDPKLLDKPEPYDGAETGWRVWKLRAVGWLSAVDGKFRQLLGEAERSEISLENVAAEIVGLDTFLFTQLLVWLEGEQLEMLLRGPENRGFEGWRTLVRAQERLEPTHKVAQLEKLLYPEFGDRASWRRKWLAWEAECLRHTVLLGGVLTGDVKISIVRQRAPADLRQHLMLTARDYGADYEAFRQKIDEYWRALGPLDEQEMDADVDYVEHSDTRRWSLR